MSLKCSVLGHRFGDPSVERSREESGNEVVITEREVRTCERCGEQRVVSENTEVTTLEPADTGDDGTQETDSTAAGTDTEGASHVAEAESDPPAGDSMEPDADPATDDGVILDADDESEADREPGAWPEEDDDDDPEWTPPTLHEEPAEEPELTVEPTGDAITVPDGIFRCGSCGFTTPVESSSLREGDFCPECHTGALAHEPGPE
ncbi:MAG: hypothetical protein ABEH64_04380 [Salinirussus sp.]